MERCTFKFRVFYLSGNLSGTIPDIFIEFSVFLLQVHSDEIAEAIQRLSARLQALMKHRYKAECDTVGAVAQLIKDAVHNEAKLPYDLRIEDNQLVVDSASVWIVSPKEQRPMPVREVRVTSAVPETALFCGW